MYAASNFKNRAMEHDLKYFYCLILLCVLVSCGPPEFERNTRLHVKGQVVDQNGQAISDTEVGVFTETGYFVGFILVGSVGQDEYLLGHNSSNASGDFSVTSLFDQDEDFFIFLDGNDTYANYIYATNTTNYTPGNYTLDIGTIELKKLADVSINVSRTSPPGTEFNFSYLIQDPYCLETYVDGVLEPNQYQCYYPSYTQRILNDEQPNYNQTHTSVLGATVELTYSINNAPELTEFFTITDENYEITLTY